jgi:hypothetical protein
MNRDINNPLRESPSDRTPWQYSLRGLLIVTTVVSVVLAIGVRLAGLMYVLGALAVIQVATILAADWLIRPQHRWALAMVSAGSWIALGTGLALIGGMQLYRLTGSGAQAEAWIIAWCALAAAAYCYSIALRRWRRLTKPLPHEL